MGGYKRKTENKDARTDKHCIARYPDHSQKRAVDPSCYYTARNRKEDSYAPTHSSRHDFDNERDKVFVVHAHDLREVKKTPKRVKQTSKPAIGFIISFIAASVLFAAFFITRISAVIVIGTPGSIPDRVLEPSGIKKGAPIWLADLDKAKADIEADPYIKVKRIACEYPSKIIIETEERIEAAAIEYMDTYIVIDREGYVLFIGERENLAGLIRVEGLRLTGCQVNKKLSDTPDIFVSTLVELIGALKDHSLDNSIETLDISNPVAVRMTSAGGLCIILGQTDRLGEKLLKLKKIVPVLKEQDLLCGILDLSAIAEPAYSPLPKTSGETEGNEEEGTEEDRTDPG